MKRNSVYSEIYKNVNTKCNGNSQISKDNLSYLFKVFCCVVSKYFLFLMYKQKERKNTSKTIIINIATATPATSPMLLEEVCTVGDIFTEVDASSLTCSVLVADNILHGLLLLAGTVQNFITGKREN